MPEIYNNIKIVTFAIVVGIIMDVVTTLYAYYTSLLVHDKNTLSDKCLPEIYNNIKIVTFAIVVSIIMNVVTTLYALNL